MFVDVDVALLQVIPQDVGIDVEDAHFLILDVYGVLVARPDDVDFFFSFFFNVGCRGA